MIIKSFDFKTKETVGDCAPSYSRSWQLDLTDDVYTLHMEDMEPEVLELNDRELHYFISKGKKKPIKLLESNGFKQWIYAQWQSGDVWGYAPYLCKFKRDILVFGNAQWSEIDSF